MVHKKDHKKYQKVLFLDFKDQLIKMSTKKNTIKFDYVDDKLKYDSVLLDNILSIFKRLGYTDKKVYLTTKTSSTSFKRIKKNRQQVKQAAKKFIKNSYDYLTQEHKEKIFFSLESNTFEFLGTKKEQEFKNGTYYGFFRKSNNIIESPFHFIMKIMGDDITVWSKYGDKKYTESTGKICFSDGSYHSLLKSRNNNRVSFLIGKKTGDPLSKVFIATWSTKENNYCSALCLTEYIENSKYKNLDSIIKDGNDVKNEILSKFPEDGGDFFLKQNNKFLIHNDKFSQ